jgi:tRNA-specific 2-thiouridylase
MSINKSTKVVVALSGGVDSAVAASVLQQRGFDVSAIFLRSWFDRSIDPMADNRCCSLEASTVARQVAERLGIPFQVLNIHLPFREVVVEYFLHQLAAGLTPNPCIVCNKIIRFDYLWKAARKSGAEYLATGHYARIKQSKNGFELWRGRDIAKDQSYMLSALTQTQLRRTLFPLGEMTKTEVRALATKLKLAPANRADSQDLCFIPKNKYLEFVSKYIPLKAGDIVTDQGKIIGRHDGLPLYTIGQREGLGIGGGMPYYVLAKDAKHNRLIVVDRQHISRLNSDTFYITKPTFTAGQPPKLPFTGEAQVRYHTPVVKAVLDRQGRSWVVKLSQPQRAVTPGQVAALYQGERLIGSGVINRV